MNFEQMADDELRKVMKASQPTSEVWSRAEHELAHRRERKNTRYVQMAAYSAAVSAAAAAIAIATTLLGRGG